MSSIRAVGEALEALYLAAERNTGYGSMTMRYALKEATDALIAAVRAECESAIEHSETLPEDAALDQKS